MDGSAKDGFGSMFHRMRIGADELPDVTGVLAPDRLGDRVCVMPSGDVSWMHGSDAQRAVLRGASGLLADAAGPRSAFRPHEGSLLPYRFPLWCGMSADAVWSDGDVPALALVAGVPGRWMEEHSSGPLPYWPASPVMWARCGVREFWMADRTAPESPVDIRLWTMDGTLEPERVSRSRLFPDLDVTAIAERMEQSLTWHRVAVRQAAAPEDGPEP